MAAVLSDWGLAARDAEWRMRQSQLSLHYTARWKEIPKVQMGNTI